MVPGKERPVGNLWERSVKAPEETGQLGQVWWGDVIGTGDLSLAPGHLGASERLVSQSRIWRWWLSPDLVPWLPPLGSTWHSRNQPPPFLRKPLALYVCLLPGGKSRASSLASLPKLAGKSLQPSVRGWNCASSKRLAVFFSQQSRSWPHHLIPPSNVSMEIWVAIQIASFPSNVMAPLLTDWPPYWKAGERRGTFYIQSEPSV